MRLFCCIRPQLRIKISCLNIKNKQVIRFFEKKKKQTPNGLEMR